MKTCLFVLLNYVFYRDLELLYGKGTYVDVNSIRYSTNNQHYIIDCKLHVSDIDLYSEITENGLKMLIEECWKYVGLTNSKLAVLITTDTI